MQAFARIVLLDPLRWLYVNAPSLGGVGGHEGLEPAEICTRLTGVPAAHWTHAGAVSCELLIDRKVRSLATTLLVLVYLHLLLSAVSALQALLGRAVLLPLRRPPRRAPPRIAARPR